MTPDQLARQIAEAIARTATVSTAKVAGTHAEGLLLVETEEGDRFTIQVERLAGTIDWPDR